MSRNAKTAKLYNSITFYFFSRQFNQNIEP